MNPAEVATNRLQLSEAPGSVGEFLATVGQPSPPKKIAGVAALLAVTLALIAGMILLFGGHLKIQVGVAEMDTIELDFLVGPLFAGAGVLAVLAVAMAVLSHFIGTGGADLRTEVLKATLRVMIENKRFGVERSTPLRSVQLRAHYVPGFAWSVVVCRSKRYRYMDEDFGSVRASDFGGADMLVSDGRLIVFANDDAKRKYLERRASHD